MTVVDVDIRFGSLVWLMIKSSFAAVIAAFITSFLWAGLATFMMALMMVGMMLLGSVGLGLAGVGASMAPPPIESPGTLEQ